MKCPKCKYITFDYVGTCPKCGKNLSSEKAKLNILSVKHNPPSILGSLTGDLNESDDGAALPDSVRGGAEDMKLEGDEIYDDGSELDINIDGEPIPESGDSAEFDLGDLGSSDGGKELEIEFGADNEEAAKEKEVHKQQTVQSDQTKRTSDEIGLDLDDVELKLESDEDEDSVK